MRPITLERLKLADVGQEHADLLSATYGESVTPTLAWCEAAAHTLDFRKVGLHYFGGAHEAAEAPIFDNLRRELELLDEAYRQAVSDISKETSLGEPHTCDAIEVAVKTRNWGSYRQLMEPHWEALRLATAPAYEIYKAATAPHYEAYRLAQARLFFQLWSNQ